MVPDKVQKVEKTPFHSVIILTTEPNAMSSTNLMHINFVSLQVSTQILPQMQPELPEKCRKPAGHAAFPGLLSNLSSSHPRGRDFRFL